MEPTPESTQCEMPSQEKRWTATLPTNGIWTPATPNGRSLWNSNSSETPSSCNWPSCATNGTISRKTEYLAKLEPLLVELAILYRDAELKSAESQADTSAP